MTRNTNEKWESSHVEYADDLCAIVPTLEAATEMLGKLSKSLHK